VHSRSHVVLLGYREGGTAVLAAAQLLQTQDKRLLQAVGLLGYHASLWANNTTPLWSAAVNAEDDDGGIKRGGSAAGLVPAHSRLRTPATFSTTIQPPYNSTKG
jgi:hypothetical protein